MRKDEKEEAWIKLVFKRTRRNPNVEDNMNLVGVHMVTECASEIVQTLGIAMQKGITKRDLDLTMAVHPTIMEEIVTIY